MGIVRITAGIAAVLVAAACGSSGPSGSQPSAPTGSATGAPPVRLAVGEAANGTTVHLAVGDVILVTLRSTYWQFQQAVPAGVLRASPASYRSQPGGPPGIGRGTARESFVAIHTGTATIRAGRASCGEALRCTGDAGRYRLTVVVG